MPNFVKLSQLQWEIIEDALIGVVYWHTESERVAQSRAISRLVARGIIERVPDHWPGHYEVRLIVPLDDVRQAAADAWARDEANHIDQWHSKPGNVLLAIERDEEKKKREETRERRRAGQARYRHERRERRVGRVVYRPPYNTHATLADLDGHQRRCVGMSIDELRRNGCPVTKDSVVLDLSTPTFISYDPQLHVAVRNSSDEEFARFVAS